jgi:hypothetical protein
MLKKKSTARRVKLVKRKTTAKKKIVKANKKRMSGR